jgi:hypothetical protein
VSFVTAINCIDGRTQGPLIAYLVERWQARYVDMVTQPGPANVIGQNRDRGATRSIYQRVDISVRAHGSKHLAIVAHHDCAAVPHDRKRQEEDVHRSVLRLSRKYPAMHILGLWLDENFQVEEISHADPHHGPRKSFSMETRQPASAGFDIGSGRGAGDQGGARTISPSTSGTLIENQPIQDQPGGAWIARAGKALLPLVLMLALSRFLTNGGDDDSLRQALIVVLVIGFIAWRIIRRVQRSNEETA